MIQVAISADFLTAMMKLPKAQQKKVNQFVNKFRNDPKSPGINYEKINDASNPDMRSVRIDQAYRGIVLQPKAGNVYVLLWVDHHDDAYDWARKTQCKVHPSTGTLQIFATENMDKSIHASNEATQSVTHKTKEKEESLPKKIFEQYTKEQLFALGLPEEFMQKVFEVESRGQLSLLEDFLPVEAFEALFFLASDIPYDEVLVDYSGNESDSVDTDDYAAAIERLGSKRRFVMVDDEDLQRILDAPLEKWRVFLHPSQRKLVERDWNGPVRVLGGAGTGKTVVAMHRAKWLAGRIDEASNKKILFTTFTKNLAADIAMSLKQICTKSEFDRIEVLNIDAWVGRFIKRHGYQYQIVFGSDTNPKRKKCWNYALQRISSDLSLSEHFYDEEWRLIVQEHRITTLKEYLKVKRTGRGTSLNRKERAKIWPVFEEYLLQLSHANLREMVDATSDCIDAIHNKDIKPIYESVIIDEGQDMGTQAYKLIRAIVGEAKNDIFVVGDGHQRIYRNRVVLGRCGIKIIGRSKKLRINYRTTEETRQIATSVLEGIKIDDLDDGMDDNKGYLSLMHGDIPELQSFDSFTEEADAICEIIESLNADGTEYKDICIVARTKALRDDYARELRKSGIQTYEVKVNGTEDRNVDGVRFATMHRVKGLEFKHLFVAGANHDVIPLRNFKSDDPVELREWELSERALLHVAMTRAVKSLMITSHGEMSHFISS